MDDENKKKESENTAILSKNEMTVKLRGLRAKIKFADNFGFIYDDQDMVGNDYLDM